MSKLLDQTIEHVRKLPDAQQDEAAKVLAEFLWGRPVRLEELDEETRAAVEEGLAQAERGEVISEEEMAKFFRSLGV